MKQYIVWEYIKSIGWQPYYFRTLIEANEYLNGYKNPKFVMLDRILTKVINVIVEEET